MARDSSACGCRVPCLAGILRPVRARAREARSPGRIGRRASAPGGEFRHKYARARARGWRRVVQPNRTVRTPEKGLARPGRGSRPDQPDAHKACQGGPRRLAVSAGPPPWSRSGQPAEPERTQDGLEIVRTRRGLFFRETEGGPLCPYITPEDEISRIERAFARPRRPAGYWSVWDV